MICDTARKVREIVMCMKEKKEIGKDVNFQRIRRITGYLVGDMDRWNSAKIAEEKDRVKHPMKGG